MRRHRGRAIRVAQFVDDERGGVRFLEETLRDFGVAIDPAGIDHAHAAARGRGDDKTPVFAVGREELHGLAGFHPERRGEARADDERVRVVAEVVERSGFDLLDEIRGLQMQGKGDAEEIDGRVWNPARALSVPRSTGEQATTFENCRLTRMISDASLIPSKRRRCGG